MISFFEKVVIKENEVMGIQSKYYSLTSFGCRDFSESFLCDYKQKKQNYVCVEYHRALDQPPQKKKRKTKRLFPYISLK